MLREQLQQDLLIAMKAKDDTTTGALRLLLASVKNKQIDLGHDLSDEEFLAVVQKEVKQRTDSISQYTAAGRTDLVETEQAEMSVLMRFMPTQLSDDEVEQHVAKALADTGATTSADMGKVMAALSHLKGQADMAKVSAIVRQRLSA